jgi:DNA-binding transcriptional MerR regulator
MNGITYTVGEVSQRTGFSIDTLRYYERLGLIEPIARSAGGARRYRDQDVGWLHFVSCLRETGMPVAAMRAFAELCRSGDVTVPERIDLLEAHGRDVEERIAALREQLAVIRGKVAYYRTLSQEEDGQ